MTNGAAAGGSRTVSRLLPFLATGNGYSRELPSTHSWEANEFVEETMRILVSLSGMLRLVAVCFVLGVALGIYLGVGGPDVAPPTPIDTTSHVDKLATAHP